MSVDIRQYTRVIVRKNGYYLQCMSSMFDGAVWSTSPYHAWWTRDMEDARDVALKTGGIMVLFNPVIGRTKVL